MNNKNKINKKIKTPKKKKRIWSGKESSNTFGEKQYSLKN
jgi:hypothetical protein